MPSPHDSSGKTSVNRPVEGGNQTDAEVQIAKLARRVEQLEYLIAQNRRKLDDIYQSRIWRMLCSVGGVALRVNKLFRGSGARPASNSQELAIYPIFPPLERTAALRGRVDVRGQIVAPRGLQSAWIQIGSEVPVQASIAAQPRAGEPADADASIYSWIWDTSNLPEGRTGVRIIAKDASGEEAVSVIPVDIDPQSRIEYGRWISTCELGENRKWAASIPAHFPAEPLISLVCTVSRPPLGFLKKCLESILAQTYRNWELKLADDGSGDPKITALLAKHAARDSRIHCVARPATGGITEVTNGALRTIRGGWLALLDSSDELPPHALMKVADAINHFPETGLFYSDEDTIDDRGRRLEPFFKPGWSPELFLSCNYLRHLTVLRRDVFEQTGFLAERYPGASQEYEYLLRVTETHARIQRIPGILYHRRSLAPGTPEAAAAGTPEAAAAGKLALQEHLDRTSPGATAEALDVPSCYRVRYPLEAAPQVSLLIPTGGNTGLLSACIESVLAKTLYRNFAIVLIDNSNGNEVEEFAVQAISRGVPLRRIDSRKEPFNYSALNNHAAKTTEAPFLLFLNDDITVDEPGWLGAMLEHAQRDPIGAVGALLLYPNGTIQHDGVVMGISNNCDHVFKGSLPDPTLYFGLPMVVRNVSAATAACLMVRRAVFEQAGGFDEQHLPVAFQDIDLCLRLGELGYRIVVTPHARLWHHESVTKIERIPDPLEVAWMQRRWAGIISADPFYNPNLTVTSQSGGLRTC
jgi:GT2 family glycosyltransferase